MYHKTPRPVLQERSVWHLLRTARESTGGQCLRSLFLHALLFKQLVRLAQTDQAMQIGP